MKSMTGFGKSAYRDDKVSVDVEIKTVNHRYADYYIKMPKILNVLEGRIRKTIGATVARGHIELFIKYKDLAGEHKGVVLNEALAREYLKVLGTLKRMDTLISDDIPIDIFTRFPDVIDTEEMPANEDALWAKVKPVLEEALKNLDESRFADGTAMQADIFARCETVSDLTERIAKRAPAVFLEKREALRQTVADYVKDAGVDDGMILNEVAVMADKLDISEELTRLKSHTDRLKTMLSADGPIGRKMDFLVQEMNREINTIGSKCNDADIANLAVDVKAEIEKIREQIQNIE